MAFVPVPSSLFAVGKAVVKQLFQGLVDNQADLDARQTSTEALASKKTFWNGTVRGASSFTTGTKATQLRIEANIDVTDVLIAIADDTTANPSGILEIDIVKATGAGDGPDFTTSVSIFTTRPSIDFSTASDYDESTSQVISVAAASLVEGDYIRMNITSKPASLGRFTFYAIGEAS